jgi:hypothetical protein
MSIECSNCEALNPSGAKFCNNCGHRLPSDKSPHSGHGSSRRPSSLPETPGLKIPPSRPDRPPEPLGRSGNPNMNPIGVGWSPTKPPPVEETPYSRTVSILNRIVEGGDSRQHPRGKITGEARNVITRHETDTSGKPLTILSFRVESFDKAGNRMQPVAVEMRGKSFQGMLNEGDQVKIRAILRKGQALRVSEVYNVTTGSRVKAKRSAPGIPMWVWNLVFFAAIALILAYCSGALD